MWLTSLLNSTLAGPANAVLQAVGFKVADAAHPWADWLATEILVVVLIVLLVALLRSRFSVDNPGGMQHTAELIFSFVKGETGDAIEHHDGYEQSQVDPTLQGHRRHRQFHALLLDGARERLLP